MLTWIPLAILDILLWSTAILVIQTVLFEGRRGTASRAQPPPADRECYARNLADVHSSAHQPVACCAEKGHWTGV